MIGNATIFWAGGLAAILLFGIAAYCVLVSRNLVRILIGLELFTKAVTLVIALAGAVTGRMALGQSFVITLIVVEVVVIAVAAGVVIASYQHTGALDARNLMELKG